MPRRIDSVAIEGLNSDVNCGGILSFYTYILECVNGTYYTGWTHDLDKRLASHSAGTGAKYTRAHGPVSLLAYWEFASKTEAMKEEWRIKQLTRKQKESLVQSRLQQLSS